MSKKNYLRAIVSVKNEEALQRIIETIKEAGYEFIEKQNMKGGKWQIILKSNFELKTEEGDKNYESLSNRKTSTGGWCF